jgi:Cdc6-like AAA superfamily ATPase
MQKQQNLKISNPFKPGAGHMPPYLAGREHEKKEFFKLLEQGVILENLVLTGLRGIGKTVLLETLKPIAIQRGWFWAGTDLSESTSMSEENLAQRLLADLSIVTSSIIIEEKEQTQISFGASSEKTPVTLNFYYLKYIYDDTPGLISDKLKNVLEFTWPYIKEKRRGVIFAYDEAQNLADHTSRNQYPLSLLLDIFQSLQRKGIRFMLVLTGLPNLLAKLVQARTFAERMFHTIFLDSLNENETREAIQKPLEEKNVNNHIKLTENSLHEIWSITKGYPYFIQYVCRDVFDVWVQTINNSEPISVIPKDEIVRKLDADFFSGRWARATDRQRELLGIVAKLANSESEFTVKELISHPSNKILEKPFTSSHVNQMLVLLSDVGLIYKRRPGKYAFAVPLLGGFILRQEELGH